MVTPRTEVMNGSSKPGWSGVWVRMPLFVGLYFLFGELGLLWQSAQTGVSPVWPASGLAFWFAFHFGPVYLLGIIPGMLAIALFEGIPLWTGLLAGVGSLLEAGVPLLILRRMQITVVRDLRSTLWFILFGPMLGPVFSASVGVASMAAMMPLSIAPETLWMYWWLGNSIGFLLVGGIGAGSEHWSDISRQDGISLIVLAALLAAFLGMVSASLLGDIFSPLTLYLLMPVISIIAVWKGHAEVLFIALSALAGVMFGTLVMHSAQVVAASNIGPLYLDISLIWLLAASGLIVSAARHERLGRESYSWLATHDSLTRLLNRHEFSQRLTRALRRMHSHAGEYVLLQVDLDEFKQVNDSEGHPSGDRVLRDVAEILRQSVRSRDSVARFGGDEFMLLLDSCSLEEAQGIATSIEMRLDNFSDERGSPNRVSASIGVAALLATDRQIEDVLQRVDEACYRAKAAGGGKIASV